jgi:transaldolase
MPRQTDAATLSETIRRFVTRGFTPRFGQSPGGLASHPAWARLRQLGTELWVDTGDIDQIAGLWTAEMTAVTTNNALLNREVQKGTYDGLIAEAARLLDAAGLDDRRRKLEIAFILNAYHALRLVERFDAYVSVEEHTDLAHDVDGAVATARRYHAICPERFIVKVPFTAAGLLATRRLSAEGVAVNHTLGFSARQNYVMSRLGRPAFVNVFVGRLNRFVADGGLGDGAYVGERAMMASQAVVRRVRGSGGPATRQIGASLRDGQQVRDLAGVDVLTIPPKAAREFLDLRLPPEGIRDRTAESYRPRLAEGAEALGLDRLWEISEQLVACVDAVERAGPESLSPAELVGLFAAEGCGDVLVRWTDEQAATIAADGGKAPLARWGEALTRGGVGPDALLSAAGLSSFSAAQKKMDDRVAAVLA